MSTKESPILFDYLKAFKFLKKYKKLRKDYRDATKGNPKGEELFGKFEKALISIENSAKTFKKEDDTIDVTTAYGIIQECREFCEKKDSSSSSDEIIRDRCIECGEIREIEHDQMCFECAVKTQARDLHDNFTLRFDALDEDEQDEFVDLYNSFVDAIEAMEQNCTKHTYNVMADIAELLEKNLPQLDEDLDEVLKEEELEEDADDEEDEEEEDDKITVYQLKRVFTDFPGQEEILPGLYRELDRAKKRQKQGEGEIVITKIKI